VLLSLVPFSSRGPPRGPTYYLYSLVSAPSMWKACEYNGIFHRRRWNRWADRDYICLASERPGEATGSTGRPPPTGDKGETDHAFGVPVIADAFKQNVGVLTRHGTGIGTNPAEVLQAAKRTSFPCARVT
jgi:hypothetical protein